MRRFMLILCLALLVSLPVYANTVTLLGIGEVEIPKNVTATQGTDAKDNIFYFLKTKDGTVWRSAALFATDIPIQDTDILKLDKVVNHEFEGIISKTKGSFEFEKAKLTVLGGRECATASIKIEVPNSGIIANMEQIVIPETNGVKAFILICADADTQYWRPIFQTIVSSVK